MEASMRYAAFLTILLLSAMIALAVPARASESGRRNTAIGATGVALYALVRGHTTTGLLAAAGAGYAWNQYNKAHKSSNRRSAYMAGYAAGARRYHTYYVRGNRRARR
jgi:hypothetical protein